MAEQMDSEFDEHEVGLWPSDWQVVALGDASTVTLGQSPPSSTYNERGIGLPFLQGKAEFGKTHPVPIKWCSQPQKKAPVGSVLVSVRAPVGDVNLADMEYCIGRGLACIEARDSAENDFLFYLLQSVKPRLEARGTGSIFKSINKDVLQHFPIPLPPLPEQRRIAHVLSTIQRAIQAQDAVIAAARELKRSLMHRLFTYGPYAEPLPTKETEIGEVPESWEVRRLGEVCDISTGTTPSTEEPNNYVGTIPFIKTAEIANNRIEIATTFVSHDAVERYRLKKYEPGTVFMAMYGQGKTRGQASLLETEATTTQNTAALVSKKGLAPEFLWLYLLSQYDNLRKEGIQGHISHLNLGYVKQYPIPLPPEKQQTDFAMGFRAIETKILSEQSRKIALEALFRSMLHQLMTGQVRVPAS